MGLSLDRSLAIKSKLANRLLDIYSEAVIFRMTHKQLLERRCERILNTSAYKKVPEWVRSFLDGMDKVLFNNLYKYHLVWMISVDGKLLTSKEVHRLTEQEKDCRGQDYKTPWSRVDDSLSHYCWKDEYGDPLRNRPFDKE